GGSDNGVAKFDLSLYVGEAEGRFTAACEYRTDLFEASTVDGLLLRYERLLEGALAKPERRVSELGLLGAEEEAATLALGRGRAVSGRERSLVHEAFAARVRESPE